jgi:hypothetical protein
MHDDMRLTQVAAEGARVQPTPKAFRVKTGAIVILRVISIAWSSAQLKTENK